MAVHAHSTHRLTRTSHEAPPQPTVAERVSREKPGPGSRARPGGCRGPRAGTFGLLCLVAALASPLRASGGEARTPPTYAIRAGKVYTVEGETLRDAVIIVSGGRISDLGEGLEIPAGTPVVDFSREVVVPGLIAAGLPLADGGSTQLSLAPDVFALDGFDFFEDRKELIRGGVTTIGVTTGSPRLVSGRGFVVKSGGHDDDISRRILRRAAGYDVTLGESSKNPPPLYDPPLLPSPDQPFEVVEQQAPTSRGGAISALRRLFDRARRWREGAQVDLEIDEAVRLAALDDLFTGRDFLHVRAERAHDMLVLLDLARDFGFRVVFDGAGEAFRVASTLAEADVPVIVPGDFVPGSLSRDDPSRATVEGEIRTDLAARLARAGVRVALRPPSGALSELLLQAVDAVRSGLTPSAALRSVTLGPAEILGVADRVGSLRPGKDADLVVLDEDPFEAAGKPVAVMIGGEMVFPEPKQPAGDITIIRCGRVLTASGDDIPGGVIVVRNGKIVAVGSAALLGAFPEAAKTIDARTETVVPGMIDVGSQLGVHVDSVRPGSGRAQPSAGGGQAIYRIADAIDMQDPQFAEVRRAGITTVVLGPEPVGYFSGQLTAVKLREAPGEQVVLKDPVGLVLGSVNASQLKKAKDYHDKWEAYEKALEEAREAEQARENEANPPTDESGGADTDAAAKSGPTAGLEDEDGEGSGEGDNSGKSNEVAGEEDGGETEAPKLPEEPARNEDYDVLRAVFRGDLLAVARVPSAAAIPALLKVLTETYGLSPVLFGFGEVDEAAVKALREKEVGVLLGPSVVLDRPGGEVEHLARRLDDAGIRFGFRSGTGSGARQLPQQIAWAVRRGWSDREALRAMTIEPAKLLGLDDRVGSIEPGKDADLVFMSGRPFSMTSRVTRVMIDGEFVHGGAAPDRVASPHDGK